jgi:serine/threonine protein kinase
MSTPRIGDGRFGGVDALAPTEDARLVARVGSALASPAGVLLVVPGLVLFIGVLLTWIGQAAIQRSSLALGREQVQAGNALIARQLGLALGQADVILNRMRSVAETHSPKAPLESVAFVMRDLLEGRAGVAYVSLCFPDGTFQGAYLEQGHILFQDSRIEASGTRVRRFGTEGRTQLGLRVEERSNYDPRTRDFYRLALASPGAAWTRAYPFFSTHYTGITRTEAVRSPNGELRAVLTVDFDVNELSRYLEHVPLADSRVLLYSDDGTLLGDTLAAARGRSLPTPSDRTLSVHDLKDPVVDALFAATAARGEGSSIFEAAGRRYLVNRVSIGTRSLGWHVASFVPEDVMLEPARAYQRRAALLALLSLAMAAGVAVLFSRHVVRMRRQTAEARAVAKRAAAAATELGSYRLTTRLGAGGMGEVWRAEHRLLAREAAIKLIRSESAPDADTQERFRREAQTLAALRSRNTIELFDYGVTDDGTFFYVMELLEGMDLETLVQRFGAQPAARVRSLMMQACNSLGEAHAAGLVHRDVKPANFYICRAADEVDVLKVLDFGLVRSLAENVPAEGRTLEDLQRELESDTTPLTKLTAEGAVLGTPDFMSTEQVLGRDTDGRTDIYAVGCVAYFLLSAQLPFARGPTATATLIEHLQSEPVDLASRMKVPLPAGMAELFMRCLAKRAEDRPQSMAELRRELSSIACPEPWTDEQAKEWWAGNVPVRPAAPFGTSWTAKRT